MNTSASSVTSTATSAKAHVLVPGLVLAAALAVVAPGSAKADELAPTAGRTIDLGDVSGVLYYTARPDGFHVVTTLAQGETGTPLRFESVLAPEQRVVISTPREAGAPARVIEISRHGDDLKVEPRNSAD